MSLASLTLTRRLAAITAKITDSFLDLLSKQLERTAFVSPRLKKGFPALTVKAVYSPGQSEDQQYYYSERAGVNSVAFVLLDKKQDDPTITFLKQWHGPLDKFTVGTYTGSLDKTGKSLFEVVAEEAWEEAGYKIDSASRIHPVGTYPVSSQTNEQVHIYVVDITGLTKDDTGAPENIFEENTEHITIPLSTLSHSSNLLALKEWKAFIAVSYIRHILS